MRGAFNTSCNLYCGPGSATPGLLLGTFPCRLVLVDGIFQAGAGSPTIVGWITIDAIEPRPSWIVPGFGVNPRLADQVEIPIGAGAVYWVVWTEEVLWASGPPYWRGNLALLPLPTVELPQGLALRELIPSRGGFVFSPVPSLVGAIAFASWETSIGGIALGSFPVSRSSFVLSAAFAISGALALSSEAPAVGSLVLSSEAPAVGSLVLSSEAPAVGSLVLSSEAPAVGSLVLSSEAPAVGSLAFL